MTEFLFEEVEPDAAREHAVADGTTVGREDCDLLLDDSETSRHHAAFRVVRSKLAVEDLGSSNGTFVNGNRIQGLTPLGIGDEVRFGRIIWRLAGTPAAQTVIRSAEPATSLREPGTIPPPPAAEPSTAPFAASGARGDVPPPPNPSASAVRPALIPQAVAAPAFPSESRPPARRASAARSNAATGISFAIILATAVALVIYFGARDDEGGEPSGQTADAATPALARQA